MRSSCFEDKKREKSLQTNSAWFQVTDWLRVCVCQQVFCPTCHLISKMVAPRRLQLQRKNTLFTTTR